MSGMNVRTASRWVGAALGLAVFAWMVLQLLPQLGQFSTAWEPVGALGVTGAFVGFFLAQGLFAMSWHRLLHAAGETGEFSGDAARWGVSLAGKYFPGKVWQAVARYGLYHGAERGGRVAPAFLREMLLGTSAAMACVAFSVGGARDKAAWLAGVFAAGSLALLLLAAPGIGMRLSALAERWLPGRTCMADTGWRTVFAAWGWQLLGYLALGLGFFSLAGGLDWPDPAWARLAIGALCFGGLAGIAAFFVPAGIGAREGAIAWFLAPTVGMESALMLAVMARLWITVGELMVVATGLAWLQRHPRAVPAP